MRHHIAWIGCLTGAIAFLAVEFSLGAATAGDKTQLDGTWLFESAQAWNLSQLHDVNNSQLKIAGSTFVVSKFIDAALDLKGHFELDESANPKTIDLHTEELDLSKAWGTPTKIEAGLRRGIYKLEGDRLTICCSRKSDGARPDSFEISRERMSLVLRKAPAGFERFPETVRFEVVDADGKPIEGAAVCEFMDWSVTRGKKDANVKWQYYPSLRTDQKGGAEMKYEEIAGRSVIARDEGRGAIAFALASPAALAEGMMRLTVRPECQISGKIECDQLKQLGRPIDWTNVYLLQNGSRIAGCSSFSGDYHFVLPPGNYELNAYGGYMKPKDVSIRVTGDRTETVIDPISLTACNLVYLEGHSAPELIGVKGWKGRETSLAELRGKYVLLEFWGYWCGPCVNSMPILFDLQEKFGDKGLAIIGVHVDNDGEVETADQLDQMCAAPKEKLWGGRDLPFPVALTSRKKEDGEAEPPPTASTQYGILSYPTTILIDREGNVVGDFGEARNKESAIKRIQSLLDAK